MGPRIGLDPTHLARRLRRIGQWESQGSTLGNISADGRYVAYISKASNLPGSSTTNWKVYRYDREARTSVMVSVDIGRQQADGDSTNVTMSDDGNRLAFQSTARSLVAPSANGQTIHVYSANMALEGRGLSLVSRKKNGPYPDGSSTAPRISGDGAVVSFSSSANDLVVGDTNGQDDAYVAVIGSDEMTLMSSAPNGDPATTGPMPRHRRPMDATSTSARSRPTWFPGRPWWAGTRCTATTGPPERTGS
ncbi:hypothetical protein [Aeromicrobium sp. UC242_57]|uniref:hypothetical protein n=1 Tax=Aeromicrobium sp. UC242_57 TaxID=3374624 RepID=UPI0037A5AB00